MQRNCNKQVQALKDINEHFTEYKTNKLVKHTSTDILFMV